MLSDRIYLDYAASTPILPEVRQAMEPYLCDAFGNPSSLHADGQRVKHALDSARDTVAAALGAEASEITFTSGGTEADNSALVGVMLGNRERGNHLITTQIEHEAILRAAAFLETLGCRVTYLPVDKRGRVAAAQVAEAVTPETVLVSVMHANNEVGVIQPAAEISALLHERGILFHTDAVQSFGQLDVRADALGADLLSISGHKIYGPKGIGALYVRAGTAIEPLLHGGGQERERRAGTENAPGIVGFAEAIRRLLPERAAAAARMQDLRDRFLAQLRVRIPGVLLNGDDVWRLPNNVNVSFPGLDAEALLLSLDLAGISASSGSACTSGSIEPSHVLQAMQLPENRIHSAIRFTLGRMTTEEELLRTVDILEQITARMRGK